MTTAAPGVEPRPRRGWGVGRVVLLVAGILGVLIALGLLTGGSLLLWADRTQRDDEGYLTTRSERFESSGYAVTSESIDADMEGPDRLLSEDVLGKVRLRAESAEGDEIFVGVGPTSDVDAYLNGVAHDEVADLNFDPFSVDYRRTEGDAQPPPPTDEDFWVASAGGPGEQTLIWEVEEGEWSAVVMNADGSEGVAADVSAGAEANFILWVWIGLLVVGMLVLIGSSTLVYLAARGGGVADAAALEPGAAGAAAVPTVYPAAVRGDLAPELSRWLWVVKWLLAIPHWIVLWFLWIAFVALSVVAFFAILFTGALPAWDLRLQRGRAALDVARHVLLLLGARAPTAIRRSRSNGSPTTPRRSRSTTRSGSRAGSCSSSGGSWPSRSTSSWRSSSAAGSGRRSGSALGDDWWWGFSGGLIGLLVLIAAVILVFTGRYQQSIFDFVLGLDRWVLRVAVYAGLMRDEYPPFRLDAGPREPEEEPREPEPPREAAG